MKSDAKDRRGFTLMEVCVALVVLMIGGTVCRYYVNTFLRLWERERLSVFMVETAVEAMEARLDSVGVCRDTLWEEMFARNAVKLRVTEKSIGEVYLLEWVNVCVGSLRESKMVSPKEDLCLRRIVKCKRKEDLL
ncbi:MAG: prepilin-type N-terminal cleavage/methylation domain-containing protein [Fibrobacter sp.]|nr:prepilin-type N-terminal cleavage/methylation domain-containing protein [Fibrobacter sp.]